MSFASSSTFATHLGSHFTYYEDDEEVREPVRISHLFPVLEGLNLSCSTFADDGLVPVGASCDDRDVSTAESQEKTESVSISPPQFSTFPIRWRGETEASIRDQLRPMVLHYQMQILLVKERTKRRVIAMQEVSEWSRCVVIYQYETPLRYKLIEYCAKQLKESKNSAERLFNRLSVPSSDSPTSDRDEYFDKQLRETLALLLECKDESDSPEKIN